MLSLPHETRVSLFTSVTCLFNDEKIIKNTSTDRANSFPEWTKIERIKESKATRLRISPGNPRRPGGPGSLKKTIEDETYVYALLWENSSSKQPYTLASDCYPGSPRPPWDPWKNQIKKKSSFKILKSSRSRYRCHAKNNTLSKRTEPAELLPEVPWALGHPCHLWSPLARSATQ